MIFRLKKGSAIVGSIESKEGVTYLDSRNPKANLIESDEDLAIVEPERYEVFTGQIPDWFKSRKQQTRGQFIQSQGSSPTNDPDELDQEADRLVQQAAGAREKARRIRQHMESQPLSTMEHPQSHSQSHQEALKEQRGEQQQDGAETPIQTATIVNTEDHDKIDRMSRSELLSLAKERKIEIPRGTVNREDIAKFLKSK